MAAMAALEAQLRELMVCKVCYEEKEYQRQLPCQHTLCLECLSKLRTKDDKYKCPTCVMEHMVPNGGFEALPESLVTKQLASMLGSLNETSTPAPDPLDSTEKSGSEGEPKPVVTSATAKRLRAAIDRHTEILNDAKEKVQVQADLQEEYNQTEIAMEKKLDEILEKRIANLKESVENKKASLQLLTQQKKEEAVMKIAKLEEACSKVKEANKQMEEKAADLESSGREENVENDLKQAKACLEILKDQVQAAEIVENSLNEGDSVRLKMDPEFLKPNFLEKDLDHKSIGYIQRADGNGGCAVIFAENARWVGKTDMLEKSKVKHNLPVIGDRVRVKRSVEEPFFKWGKIDHSNVGILKEVKNAGPSEGREISIDFPEDSSWKALFEEIEKAPPEALKVGDEVWICKNITEPARGWAGVTKASVGTLLSVNGEDVAINFPECENWQGLLSEVEKVRPISVGDKVKVKKSVKEPKTGWAGITHDDEGIVKNIKSNFEYGKVAGIDFPKRVGLWHCPIAELDLVSRQAAPPRKGGRAGSPVVDMEQVMEATHHVTQQMLGQQCKQQ